MARPTLSLLIPAYNAARYLPRLLASAHAQSIPFDEIWVYDDCSTDDTAKVAAMYGAKVLKGAVNVGCSQGKQALAKHVQTDWIHFHDADDELLPNFTTLAHRWIEHENRDVVLFAYEYRDDTTGNLLGTTVFDDDQLREDPKRYAITNQINPFCGLYRRTPMLAAGGYDLDPRSLYNEDVAFHIRLAFAGLTFAAESEVSIINWRVSGSMSEANRAKCAISQAYVLTSVLELKEAIRYQEELADRLWGVSGQLAAVSEWKHARRTVAVARSLAPPPESAGRYWFRAMAHFSDIGALAVREFGIRLFRPNLREGFPKKAIESWL